MVDSFEPQPSENVNPQSLRILIPKIFQVTRKMGNTVASLSFRITTYYKLKHLPFIKATARKFCILPEVATASKVSGSYTEPHPTSLKIVA